MDTKTKYIQDVIKEIFAAPEREQPAEWAKIIDHLDYMIGEGYNNAVYPRKIFLSIMAEAKSFD